MVSGTVSLVKPYELVTKIEYRRVLLARLCGLFNRRHSQQ
jgi:hypothetical protein